MSRNSSGTYTLPSGNPVVSGTLIEATWANTTLSDLASAMTDSLSRSGQGGMTAALRLADGTSSVPGLAWGSETTSGWYRAGAGDMRLMVTGTEVMKYLATGVSVTGTFAASGNSTVGGTLGVTGAATLSSTLAVTGAATFSGGIAGSPVINDGTANGVAYLNGSKVLTSGSALTFDGTKLTSGAFGNTGRRLEVNGSEALFDGAGQFDLLMGDGGVAYMSLTTTDNATGLKIRNYSGNSDIAVFERTTGNVGIGTSSPSYKLDVVTAGTTGGRVYTAEYGQFVVTDGTRSVYIQNYTGLGSIGTSSNNALAFTTNSVERMRLSADGNLGLGVTPSAWASSYKAFQIGSTASLVGATNFTFLNTNAYFDSSDIPRYLTTAAATRYQQDGGAHKWFTAPSGTAGDAISFTQAMTLNASGKLDVPQSFVSSAGWQSNGTTYTTAAGIYNGVYGLAGDVIAIATAGAERARIASNGNVSFGTSDTNVAGLMVYRAGGAAISLNNSTTGTSAASGFQLQGGSGGDAYVWNYSNSFIAIGTNNTERARIDALGNLLVGTAGTPSGSNNAQTTVFNNTASQDGLVVYHGASTSGANSMARLATIAASSASNPALVVSSGNGSTLTANNLFIYTNGNVANSNNSYGAISDAKLKENVVDATPKLEKINQVRIVNFNLIGQEQKQLGVIAQELEQIFPGMVEESPDRDAEGNDLGTTTKSVKYSVFVPMLIKAVQEQQAIIASLEARISALESA